MEDSCRDKRRQCTQKMITRSDGANPERAKLGLHGRHDVKSNGQGCQRVSLKTAPAGNLARLSDLQIGLVLGSGMEGEQGCERFNLSLQRRTSRYFPPWVHRLQQAGSTELPAVHVFSLCQLPYVETPSPRQPGTSPAADLTVLGRLRYLLVILHVQVPSGGHP